MNMDKFFRPVPNKIPQINPELFLNFKDPEETQKDEIPNMDERAAQNRAAGNTQRQEVVETIVRDQPKIGRNDRVTIKHVMSGENKTVKYKQAEPLIAKAAWVLTEHNN